MITVTKSTYVPKENTRMKLLSIKMNLDANAGRCEAMLSFIEDPIVRASLEIIKQNLKDDIKKLNQIEKEIERS